MADVIISYKREDKARVSHMVACLEAAGQTVWWGAVLDIGGAVSETIVRELDAARCVLVVLGSRTAGIVI